MRLLPILALAFLLPQLPEHAVSAGDPAPASLQALRDRYRPLLIFSPDEDLPAYLQQMGILTAHASGLAERDVALVPIILHPYDLKLPETSVKHVILTPLGRSEARQQFHVARNSFTVILIGKDGGEKLRSHTPFSYEQLRDAIDSMPMRQEEMKKQGVGSRE